MEHYIAKILQIELVTHNVKRFTIERPAVFTFIPGQATDVSINKPGWDDQLRPFTFTGLAEWNHLEFTIKIYSDHPGVTDQLGKLTVGDELIVHHVWGAIQYHGEGTFIAGGAGVTPFIAIFRQLQKDGKLGANTLLCSNNTEKDIILKDEFTRMLGNRFINTLSQQQTSPHDNRIIDKKYLDEKIKSFNQYFYLCGPDPMVEAIKTHLLDLGAPAKQVIVEQF